MSIFQKEDDTCYLVTCPKCFCLLKFEIAALFIEKGQMSIYCLGCIQNVKIPPTFCIIQCWKGRFVSISSSYFEPPKISVFTSHIEKVNTEKRLFYKCYNCESLLHFYDDDLQEIQSVSAADPYRIRYEIYCPQCCQNIDIERKIVRMMRSSFGWFFHPVPFNLFLKNDSDYV